MASNRPPLLPAEVYRRVLRVSRFDGTTILVIATAFAFGSAMLHDVHGTIVSLMVAGAGAIELHGAGILGHGEERGLRWLVTAQVYLMFVMLSYVLYSLGHVDIAGFRHLLASTADDMGMPRDQLRQALAQSVAQSGVTMEESLRAFYEFFYLLVGLATVVFQGSMAIYYARRQPAIVEALKK
jgi:hypothetical protein